MSNDDLERIRERKREEFAETGGAASEEADAAGSLDEGSAERSDEPIHVDSVEEFSEVTTGDGVVIVDFYADWCGPCKMLEPVVASVAADTDAAVAKVDVDDQRGLASQYGVRSVPTLVIFADGEQVEQLVGMQDEEALTRLVDRYA